MLLIWQRRGKNIWWKNIWRGVNQEFFYNNLNFISLNNIFGWTKMLWVQGRSEPQARVTSLSLVISDIGCSVKTIDGLIWISLRKRKRTAKLKSYFPVLYTLVLLSLPLSWKQIIQVGNSSFIKYDLISSVLMLCVNISLFRLR